MPGLRGGRCRGKAAGGALSVLYSPPSGHHNQAVGDLFIVNDNIKPAASSLTPKQRRFVDEYLVDMNASAAARRAGYSPRTADRTAHETLKKPEVAAAIAAARARVSQKLEIDAERVLSEAWNILTADPRELVEFNVGCCRYCWGAGHRYQRTPAEMERDRAEATNVGAQFDEQGGVGFHGRRAPNSECPECFGDGQGRTVLRDTRTISAAAASLYAGVKQTRDGFEVKLLSKVDAMERLARHLGLYDRFKVTGAAAEMLRADSIATLSDRGRALIAAAATGDVPLSQAAQLLAGLGSLAKLVETDELAARIAALEARHGNKS